MVWLVLLLLILAAWSVFLRWRYTVTRRAEEVTASPLSQALGDLVKAAGGIYVSLLALFSFLKIEVPGGLSWLGLNLDLDPLAFLSLLLAILQPFLLPFFRRP